jgi:hypothetical protein
MPPRPLAVRKSLTSFNYWTTILLSFVWFVFAYGLFARWPRISTNSETNEYLLAGLLVIVGVVTLIYQSIRPVFDREPLLQIDESGMHVRENGTRVIPWREVGDCRFELVSEGRSSNWYFFFSEVDAGSGLKFNHQVRAEEFDGDHSDILSRIERFKAADRKPVQPRARPDAVGTDGQGDMLEAGYSRSKGWTAIGVYWAIALFVAVFAIALERFSNSDFDLFLEYIREPLAVLALSSNTVRFIGLAAFALAAFGSVFRLRDMYFRTLTLRADRTGLSSPEFGDEPYLWENIRAMSFEPTGTLQITVTAPDPAERFLDLGRSSLSEREIFEALAWLLVRFKVRMFQA